MTPAGLAPFVVAAALLTAGCGGNGAVCEGAFCPAGSDRVADDAGGSHAAEGGDGDEGGLAAGDDGGAPDDDGGHTTGGDEAGLGTRERACSGSAAGLAVGCGGITTSGHPVAQSGSVVPEAYTGGPIADGSYVLTSFTSSVALEPVPAMHLVVSGGCMETAGLDEGVSDYIWSVSGAMLTLSRSCPSVPIMILTVQYTATPTSMTWEVNEGLSSSAYVFTRE